MEWIAEEISRIDRINRIHRFHHLFMSLTKQIKPRRPPIHRLSHAISNDPTGDARFYLVFELLQVILFNKDILNACTLVFFHHAVTINKRMLPYLLHYNKYQSTSAVFIMIPHTRLPIYISILMATEILFDNIDRQFQPSKDDNEESMASTVECILDG